MQAAEVSIERGKRRQSVALRSSMVVLPTLLQITEGFTRVDDANRAKSVPMTTFTTFQIHTLQQEFTVTSWTSLIRLLSEFHLEINKPDQDEGDL